MKYLLLILFLFVYAFSQQLSPSEALENVRVKYSKLNDLSADFIQSVKLRYKKSGQKTSGSIQIKKGNKYRIEMEQQLIVTDGKNVWLYTPNTKQVLVDKFKTTRQQFSPEKFLTSLPKDFSASKLDTINGQFIITLEPLKTSWHSSTITDAKVWVNKDSWLLNHLEYNDKNGTITSFTLSNIRFNNGIADSNFQFKITTDMKVVDVNSLKQ